MHICHVITRLIIGGAQENTVLTCRGLVDRGHRVSLVAGPETGPEGSLWDQAERAGCELVRIDAMRRAVNPWRDFLARRELERYFRRARPEIVHTHSSKAGILGRAAAANTGVPIVVHTIHGMSFNRTQPVLTRRAYIHLERRAARRTTMFITVADAMIDQSIAARIAPRDRFVTVRSGMETDQFRSSPSERDRLRREWGVADDEVVVGTVARLFKNKGYEELIAAMPGAIVHSPRLRFVWIGDGAHRDEYVRRLTAIGVRDRVRLVGLVPPAELPTLLNGFDLVVHASRWEGLPRVLVQALLMEVPVVSFDNDGAPEVVLPGVTGVLAPFGDIAALSDGIATLAADAELRRRLGANGRRRCLHEFDWREMVRRIESVYERLTEARAK